jgi:hypothetical protein
MNLTQQKTLAEADAAGTPTTVGLPAEEIAADPKRRVAEAYEIIRRIARTYQRAGFKGMRGASVADAWANEYMQKLGRQVAPMDSSTAAAREWLDAVLAPAKGDQPAPRLADLVSHDPAAIRAVSVALRRILINLWEKEQRRQPGAPNKRIELEVVNDDGRAITIPDLIAHDEAMELLHTQDAEAAAVAELRLMRGMTHGEIARQLGITERESQDRWARAKGFLRGCLEGQA